MNRYGTTLAALSLAILTGGVWTALAEPDTWALATRLYGDRTARAKGDLVTIVIVEESQSSKDASRATDQSTAMGGSMGFSHPRVDSRSVAWTNISLPAYSLDVKNSSSGKGSASTRDSLSGAITARIIEVLPNGTLLIEGKKTVTIQKDYIEITVSGTIRREDIASDNTVKSTSVADATIRLESTGSVSDAAKRGWFGRIIDWVNPF